MFNFSKKSPMPFFPQTLQLLYGIQFSVCVVKNSPDRLITFVTGIFRQKVISLIYFHAFFDKSCVNFCFFTAGPAPPTPQRVPPASKLQREQPPPTPQRLPRAAPRGTSKWTSILTFMKACSVIRCTTGVNYIRSIW